MCNVHFIYLNFIFYDIAVAPQPASPSVYRAVQRGEDIPFQGLQRTAPMRQLSSGNGSRTKCK